MIALAHRSIEIILANQAASGAYVASPNFPTYHYCWLRDGSFIAYAMDLAGEHASARAFFRWVHRTITRCQGKVDYIEQCLSNNQPLRDSDFLHTRYTVDGDEGTADKGWGNFQLDGYGTWLWALGEHIRRTGDMQLLTEVASSVNLTVRYINTVWRLPNYDCWEEHPEYLHPYSLGTACAGLRAAGEMARLAPRELQVDYAAAEAEAIAGFISNFGADHGRLVKHVAPGMDGTGPHPVYDAGVDASLIGLATPYRVFAATDPLFEATLAQVERDLHRPEGGVYRYRNDTYYGGGEWLLLACWLGWHYATTGSVEKARALLEWVTTQVDEQGYLPEQVSDHMLAPQHLKPWRAKWGLIASPLLWSHAMFLILHKSIEETQSEAWTLSPNHTN